MTSDEVKSLEEKIESVAREQEAYLADLCMKINRWAESETVMFIPLGPFKKSFCPRLSVTMSLTIKDYLTLKQFKANKKKDNIIAVFEATFSDGRIEVVELRLLDAEDYLADFRESILMVADLDTYTSIIIHKFQKEMKDLLGLYLTVKKKSSQVAKEIKSAVSNSKLWGSW